MSSWKSYKLGDIAEITSSKRIFYSEYVPSGIPFWRSKEVIEKFNRKNISTDLFISNEKYQEIKSKFGVPQQNDILLTSVGTLGIPYLVQSDEQFYFKDGNLTWIKNINNELLNPLFLFKWLASSIGRESLSEITIGSTQEALTISGLKTLELLLPPLEEQKAIAEVLSSLDDKIELLHRQNQTLESLAQTLFRQWFIEEAKEEWEEKPLSKIADFLNGLACQKFPPKNDIDKLPVLKIKDLKDGVSENSDYATSDVKPEYIVNNGDVIFAWSASLMVKIWNGDKCVLNQHLFKVISKDYPKWFYYQWCKYHLDNFIDIASEHATTMGHIKRSDLDEAICLVPNIDELDKMTEQFNPIMEKLEINSRQIQTLENLRDTLLPKLLIGEVRVEI
ncbi:MAG: restriction endonuclease subunit S [Aliarcobacter sp.]|nr:restriction endonuclease subunit S [Aliarcobacter sp.]